MSFARQPLDVVMASTGNVRVMRALLAHGGPLPISRLAADTKLTSNGVRWVLHELERAGIVESHGSGRTRLYQADSEHSIVTALDALFTAERNRFKQILASVVTATEDDSILAVWLFGSVARGEDRIESDVDIAVVISAGPDEISAVADKVRDALVVHEKRLGFTASIISTAPEDIRRLSSERARLWVDLQRDAQVLRGPAPNVLLQQLHILQT